MQIDDLLAQARDTLARLRRTQTAQKALGILKEIKDPVLVVAAVFVSTTAIAQPFYVPSGSMQPTLQVGDGLIAAKYPYGYSRYSLPLALGPSSPTRLFQKLPERGDVVVFRLPRNPSQTLVKRLIGLPGDRIQMRAGRLWINGAKLALRADGTGDEEWHDGTTLQVSKFIETLPGGRTHPIYKHTWSGRLDDTDMFVVPKGRVFMMGDNRDDSLDSRVAESDGGVGYVPIENLVGRAEIVVGSYDFLGAQSLGDWFGRIRTARFFRAID